MAWSDYSENIGQGAPGEKGDAGSDGTVTDSGDWATSTVYGIGQRVGHTKTGYGKCRVKCTVGHTSGASTEPYVGASWQTVWEEYVGGGSNGEGSGDFVGPASSTTNNVVGFGNTTGKLGKDLGTFDSLLSTALSAITTSTTMPDGDVDYILTKESGGWKLKLLDNLAKSWRQCQMVAQSLQPRSTAGSSAASTGPMTTYKHDVVSMAFLHNGSPKKSYACFTFLMPEGWDGGELRAYVVWNVATTSTDSVRWGIQAACVADNEALDLAFGTAVEVTDTATGTAYRALKAPRLDSITPSGTPAGGELLELEVYRDPENANDNLEETAYLITVALFAKVKQWSEF